MQSRQTAPTPNNINRMTGQEPSQTQTRASTGTADAIVVSIPPGTELLASQIQTFLRASQDEELDGDVELDEEVVQDILSVLSTPGSGGEAGLLHGQLDVMADGGDDDDSDDMSDLTQLDESKDDTLEGQLIFPNSDACLFRKINKFTDSGWQQHEVRAMIHFLKEHGKCSFADVIRVSLCEHVEFKLTDSISYVQISSPQDQQISSLNMCTPVRFPFSGFWRQWVCLLCV